MNEFVDAKDYLIFIKTARKIMEFIRNTGDEGQLRYRSMVFSAMMDSIQELNAALVIASSNEERTALMNTLDEAIVGMEQYHQEQLMKMSGGGYYNPNNKGEA